MIVEYYFAEGIISTYIAHHMSTLFREAYIDSKTETSTFKFIRQLFCPSYSDFKAFTGLAWAAR
jgi:hypothetical protein